MTPAPPRSPESSLTPAQWTTFYALTSAIVPSIPAETLKPVSTSQISTHSLEIYAKTAADASNDVFRAAIEEMFERIVPPARLKRIKTILDLLKLSFVF